MLLTSTSTARSWLARASDTLGPVTAERIEEKKGENHVDHRYFGGGGDFAGAGASGDIAVGCGEAAAAAVDAGAVAGIEDLDGRVGRWRRTARA